MIKCQDNVEVSRQCSGVTTMFRCHDNVHVKGQYSGVTTMFMCKLRHMAGCIEKIRTLLL